MHEYQGSGDAVGFFGSVGCNARRDGQQLTARGRGRAVKLTCVFQASMVKS